MAAIASSKISSATSTFSFVSINGGDQRIVLAPAEMINPRSKHATFNTIAQICCFKLAPIIIPMPRTSTMHLCFC